MWFSVISNGYEMSDRNVMVSQWYVIVFLLFVSFQLSHSIVIHSTWLPATITNECHSPLVIQSCKSGQGSWTRLNPQIGCPGDETEPLGNLILQRPLITWYVVVLIGLHNWCNLLLLPSLFVLLSVKVRIVKRVFYSLEEERERGRSWNVIKISVIRQLSRRRETRILTSGSINCVLYRECCSDQETIGWDL